MRICMEYIIIGRDGKNNKVFCGLFVLYSRLLLQFLFVKYSSENKKSKKCVEYNFVGYYTDSLIPDNYRERLSGISYDNNADPYGVYNDKKAVISNYRLAGIIAKNVLSNIYGEKQINSELPLKISLINNRFWQIEGSLPPNMTGGTAIIVIKKDDGQIQYIRHTK